MLSAASHWQAFQLLYLAAREGGIYTAAKPRRRHASEILLYFTTTPFYGRLATALDMSPASTAFNAISRHDFVDESFYLPNARHLKLLFTSAAFNYYLPSF